MRIEPTGTVAAASDTPAVGRATRSDGVAETAAVQVSPSVGELGRASSRSQLERAQQIAALRAKVNNGTYQVNRNNLALAIAEEELSRAGRG